MGRHSNGPAAHPNDVTCVFVCTDDEKKLVEEVFSNAIDCLSDEDKKLPQVRTSACSHTHTHTHRAVIVKYQCFVFSTTKGISHMPTEC